MPEKRRVIALDQNPFHDRDTDADTEGYLGGHHDLESRDRGAHAAGTFVCPAIVCLPSGGVPTRGATTRRSARSARSSWSRLLSSERTRRDRSSSSTFWTVSRWPAKSSRTASYQSGLPLTSRQYDP